MYFFAQFSHNMGAGGGVIFDSDVAGFQQINVLARFIGAPGTVVEAQCFFNGITAYSNQITIGAGGTANFAMTYAIHGPLFGIYFTPSEATTVHARVYAACCEPPKKFLPKLLGTKRARNRQGYRIVTDPAEIEALTGGSSKEEVEA